MLDRSSSSSFHECMAAGSNIDSSDVSRVFPAMFSLRRDRSWESVYWMTSNFTVPWLSEVSIASRHSGCPESPVHNLVKPASPR